MHLSKCPKNHYYNADKFPSCPHCANLEAGISEKDLIGANQSRIPTVIPLQAANASAFRGKTTGWLTCIDGHMLGESFSLREGENYIGRSANMDVALLQETTVSRDNHCIILFDNAQNSFHITITDQEKAVFLNKKRIHTSTQLKHHDVITLGDCSLLFIPLCDNHFQWPDIVSGD